MARLARYLSGLEQHPDDLAGWGRDDEEQARQPLWQDQANGRGLTRGLPLAISQSGNLRARR